MQDERSERLQRQLKYHDWCKDHYMTDRQYDHLKMLKPLREACKECTMCNLGNMGHVHNGVGLENFHVFSNMRPSKFMVVGQNPGYNECEQDEPFVGPAGDNFNIEVARNGITRDKFYITNIVKCHTPENRKPEQDEVEICESFLRMELKLLRPILVIALGAVAFEALCPGTPLSEGLGRITKSRLGVKVYAVYHPSPRNLSNKSRKLKFEQNIATLCALIKKLEPEPNLVG